MESCAEMLYLQEWGWSWGNTKLATPISGSEEHSTLILVGPPLTVTWAMRTDGTTSLAIRAPLVLYTESDAIILPPADSQGTAFYVDPPAQPGMHADMFRGWAKHALGELLSMNFPLSEKLRSFVPMEYPSEESEAEQDSEGS